MDRPDNCYCREGVQCHPCMTREVVLELEEKGSAKVCVGPCEVTVLIGGLPHLILRRSDLTGVQSYIKNVGVREPVYFIEFSTHSGIIITDYDRRSLWESILGGLRDARLFDNMQGASPLPGSA